MKKLSGMFVLAGVICLLLPGTAASQTQHYEFNVKVTGAPLAGSSSDYFMTFSAPVQLPGVSLQSGTYVFRVIDPSVVQVLSRDRKTVYTAFFTLPAERPAVDGKLAVDFKRVDDKAPLRLIRWFEPSELDGHEVYYGPSSAAAMTSNAER